MLDIAGYVIAAIIAVVYVAMAITGILISWRSDRHGR